MIASSAGQSGPKMPASVPAAAAAAGSLSPSTWSGKAAADPILRNALRYTISAREYALLHRYVLSRSRLLKRRVPAVETMQRVYGSSRPRASLGDTDKSKAAATPGAVMSGERADSGVGPNVDDYNARAIRHSIRVFVATGAAMKLWEVLSSRLMAKHQE